MLKSLLKGILLGMLILLIPIRAFESSTVSYYDWFLNKVTPRCSKLKYNSLGMRIVTLSTLEPGVIGQCASGGVGFLITYDPEFWNSASAANKRLLVAHELTHCLFKELHSSDPNHYMYDSLPFIDDEQLNEQIEMMIKKHCEG